MEAPDSRTKKFKPSIHRGSLHINETLFGSSKSTTRLGDLDSINHLPSLTSYEFGFMWIGSNGEITILPLLEC